MLPARDLVAAPFSHGELTAAASAIHDVLAPTPAIAWPLLAERAGCKVFVKHENHLPTGAFKVRGGVWLMQQLAATVPGVVAATRGNHGQSIAFAAARSGRRAVIVVPHGNNPDKNRAMRAYGAELVEHGEDFDAALAHAGELAAARGLLPLPSFHPLLVQGVASYALELFADVPDLDTVYAPIGLGSGVAGLIAARDALGLSTAIVGVVSTHADAYAQSFELGRVVATARADTIADGMAVRTPSADAFAYLQRGLARVVRVDDAAVCAAMRHYLDDTHNLAEGAGAAPLAALLAEAPTLRGRRVALVLSGGNVDHATLRRVLAS
ncbi:MAG: threonine dehydratase [Gammaproteobacteria bacterium]